VSVFNSANHNTVAAAIAATKTEMEVNQARLDSDPAYRTAHFKRVADELYEKIPGGVPVAHPHRSGQNWAHVHLETTFQGKEEKLIELIKHKYSHHLGTEHAEVDRNFVGDAKMLDELRESDFPSSGLRSQVARGDTVILRCCSLSLAVIPWGIIY
jgi:hypothetical protein